MYIILQHVSAVRSHRQVMYIHSVSRAPTTGLDRPSPRRPAAEGHLRPLTRGRRLGPASENEQNRTEVLFNYYMALGIQAVAACFEHSNLFTANVPAHRDTL
jgi:hypothetical protein